MKIRGLRGLWFRKDEMLADETQQQLPYVFCQQKKNYLMCDVLSHHTQRPFVIDSF